MGRTLYWNPNTLVLPQGGGLVRLFQALDRRNVLATLPVLGLVNRLVGGADEDGVKEEFGRLDPRPRLADATDFTLWDHTFANPDFFDRSVGEADVLEAGWDDFLELMLDTRIVTDCWPPPTDYHKRHFGDRFRGSFHEQIATESLFRRTSPAAWWTAQKFEPDHARIRPTPYRYIEERFLEHYFAEHFAGKSVLDIGSGTGYFTAKMAQHASKVIGIDYNADYVAIARETRPPEQHPNLSFQVGDIIDLSKGSSSFSQETFDVVVLIDTFLFLFESRFQSALWEHRTTIMRNLRRLVKPDGILLVFDPHPLWLTPWLGSPECPIGVLTEYRSHRFKVIPTVEELTCFLCENGMRLRRVLEPQIDEEYQSVDAQSYAFMREVPQWWLLEIEPAGK